MFQQTKRINTEYLHFVFILALHALCNVYKALSSFLKEAMEVRDGAICISNGTLFMIPGFLLQQPNTLRKSTQSVF